MLAAPIPPNEPERLASLRRMQLLATPDEECFDRITRTAQRLFQVPIALVSLVDGDRQWFKSCLGVPVRETPREVSFCGHAILDDQLFVVEDARQDPRFADNPLVTGEAQVTFYAGRPLRNSEGFNIGTLCLIDKQPRAFSQESRQSLDDLGHWVESVLLSRELGEVEQSLLDELDEIKRTSLLDPVLNLWRDTAIYNIATREAERCFHTRRVMSVMKVRLEGFSPEASTGQPALIELSKRIRPLLRTFDSLGYLGQGEFLALLPDTDQDRAKRTGERLSSTANLYPMVQGDEVISLTVSIGAVTVDYSQETPDPQALLDRVGQALEQASARGGNRFVLL